MSSEMIVIPMALIQKPSTSAGPFLMTLASSCVVFIYWCLMTMLLLSQQVLRLDL